MAKQPSTGIPAGFQQVSTGQFPPNHDFRKEAVCTGTVQQVKESEQKRGSKTEKVKILYIADNETGELSAVWESASLKDFFTQVKPRDAVYIRYDGTVKLKGKKTLKKFTCAIHPKGKK